MTYGCVLGVKLGDYNGFTDGTALGYNDGIAYKDVPLGDMDGTAYGTEVFVVLGIALGLTDGSKLGIIDGCILDIKLGDDEGFTDGIADGCNDGIA